VKAVSNGEELFDYLYRRGKFKGKDMPFPKVILLDLNMPRKDGKTCLQELKGNSKFNKIPVIILSMSNNPQDVSQCYALGANSDIEKPSSYRHLTEVLSSLNSYWFSAAKIPDLNYE
jgi:CheY-like chemotaxis protein